MVADRSLPASIPSSFDGRHGPDLDWLVRLRWLASFGQGLAFAVAPVVLAAPLPYLPLLALVGITVSTNLFLARAPLRFGRAVVVAILTLDTLTFTAMLHLTGGPDNPFSLLYAIHVALAAVALGGVATWWLAGLSVCAYAWLFAQGGGEAGGLWHMPFAAFPAFRAHLVGMWIAMAIVVAAIAFFAGRISAALRARQRQVSRLRTEAERSARLASVATLAAGAAHELGSPLGTIAVVAREIERAALAAQGEGALAQDARLVRAEVNRCRAILDRMIASGAPETKQEPGLLVDDFVRAIEARLGADARRVRIDVRPSAGAAAWPRDLLEVVVPLLRNGVEASSNADANVDTDTVELRIMASDDGIALEVDDRGTGMEPGVLAHVGEPFFTTKPPGRGTGLGLHVARLVCQRLGGSLEIASTLGVGTRARIAIPLACSDESRKAGGPRAPVRCTGQRLLSMLRAADDACDS